MSYSQLIQNYIDASYAYPPNLADPCERCPKIIFSTPSACPPRPPVCVPVCQPCQPCPPPCPPPCCDKKKKCSKKCSKKKCSKKDKNIRIPYNNPCGPPIEIATCPTQCVPTVPVCPPPPPPPCNPCEHPWIKGWPWITQSWSGNIYNQI